VSTPPPPHSSGPPRPSPIERFLGRDATRAGPFGLLRLTPETCTDERILASLEWQLDRVGQHPEGDTPEADEVRLALHAAAAQLLDPNVRRYVLSVLQQRGEGAIAPAAAAPTAVQSGVRLTGLEQDALRTLAAYGGWNKQSLERLKALAYARGMGSREVAQTLQNLATGRRRPPASPAASQRVPRSATAALARAAASPARDEPPQPTAFVDPGARYVRNLLLVIGGVLLLLVAVVVGAVLMLSGPPAGTAGATAGTPGDAANPPQGPVEPQASATDAVKRTPPADGPSPSASAPRTEPEADAASVDPVALVRELAACAAQARREPELAAERFPALARQLAARWCKLEQSQRRASDVAVLDVVFATASYPEVSQRVLDAIADGARELAAGGAMEPRETWPAVWSAGILTRLSRERELPHVLSSRIDTELTGAIGRDRPRADSTFESGAVAALRLLPERLVAGEPASGAKETARRADGALRPWLEALQTIVGTDADQRERMLVDALQRILTAAAEPSVDQRVFDAVQTLVTEIKWRKGGPARPRFLDWFKDPRVSMQDLQVVTSALASKSSAEGVDAMMVLSVGAAPSDRQRLRTAYAKAWGIAESVGEDKASADWLVAARAEIDRTTEGLHATDFLVMSVALARLNEAATRLWRGESDQVASLVVDAVDLPNNSVLRLTTPMRRVLTQNVEGDGQWTASYQSLGRNVPTRQEKLSQMEKFTLTIGPVDAEQLFYLACYETPAELRASAQSAVEKLSAEAAIVNAALELLPRAPRYTTVASLYEQVARRRLPSPNEPSWELEARRALVARLLELLAGASEDAKVDELSRMLFDAYAVRAGRPGLGETDERSESGADLGLEVAAELSRAWRADAEAVAPNEYAPITLDAIDRRRTGRLRLAQGPVQLFAAEQVAGAELMAYVVSGEKPRLAKQVQGVIDDMATGRRGASHIFEQMAYAERAMLRLWLLRIAGDQP
jgi:hypothetical protein